MQTTLACSLVEATAVETGLAALGWDRAPGYWDSTVQVAGLPLIGRLTHALELNPADRVFESLRTAIEGVVDLGVDDRVVPVEMILEELDADPEQAKQLTGSQ